MTALALVGGLTLLVAGAELLVRGASRIALGLGLSPLIVGLTVVAFGTSAPELAVSVSAAARGAGDLAIGNVVGSNIFNVLVILGVSALVAPLIVAERLVRLDVPVMIGVSLLLVLLAADGSIGAAEALLLVAGFAAYTAFLAAQARRGAGAERGHAGQAVPSSATERPEDGSCGDPGSGPGSGPHNGSHRGLLVSGGLVVVGVVLLLGGSRWLVEGSTALASALGVSELVIGLTVVAAGTSLPEMATSLVATIRGQRDMAVGNVVGSNIFNVLAIVGLSGLLTPLPAPAEAVRFDLPVMAAVAAACLPVFFTGRRIARWEGALFLGYYAAYVAYLVLRATGHAALPVFSASMAFFVLPLTVVTLGVLLARDGGGR